MCMDTWVIQIYLWWLEIYYGLLWLFSVWPLLFSNWVHQIFCWQAKHAAFLLFRLTWTSSCVRVRRLSQPRNGLTNCRCQVNPHWKWQVLPEGQQNLKGRVVSGAWDFTMVLSQESGQLPLSRLGDAISEVGVLSSFLFSFSECKKHDFLISFGAEKLKRYWSSNRSWVFMWYFCWSHLQVLVGSFLVCLYFISNSGCESTSWIFTPLKPESVEILKGVAGAAGHWSGSDIGEVSAVDAGSDWSVKCLGWWVSLADSGPI